MKAATGELNLTVITLIAIAAVLGFFWAMWPTIKGSITKTWNNTTSDDANVRKNNQTYNSDGIYTQYIIMDFYK